MTFTETILHWYAAHRRELPWRNISDPYRIWVSEIILQQTRVAQGYDYYLRFVNAFPTVETLAERYDGKARVGKINVDQDPELARHFGVMSIPTVVFLKGGREIARKVGVMPEAVYDGLIQENL